MRDNLRIEMQLCAVCVVILIYKASCRLDAMSISVGNQLRAEGDMTTEVIVIIQVR